MSELRAEHFAIPAEAWTRWHKLAASLSDDFFAVTLELRDARRCPSRRTLRHAAEAVQCAVEDAPGIIQRNAAKQLLADLKVTAES